MGYSSDFQAVPSSGLATVPVDIDPVLALQLLRQDGVLVIEGALDKTMLAQMRSDVFPWFEKAFPGEGPLFGQATRRFSGLFAKAPSTSALAVHPVVLSLMEAVLRGDGLTQPICDVIELNLTQAIGIGAGEPAQFLHRDEDLWPFKHDYEIMADVMWTLDDFTVENGATRFIPGSHRWPRDRQPLPGEAVSAIAPAGSAIIWLGSLLHGGGANRSNDIRRGMVISYRVAWIAPIEKLLLSVPPDVARQLPERLQRLLGYQLHRPNLGWVEGQDPINWLRGEFTNLAPCRDNLAPEHEVLLAQAKADPSAFAGYIS
jgi:hypothetical protein